MMLLSDAAKAISATPSAPIPDVAFCGVCTDSRTVKKGELFFALCGAHFDGHNFVGQALQKGACAAVVSKSVATSGVQLRVSDTLDSLGKLAAFYRQKLTARVIAVTGTNGKTTTKEMMAHLLAGAHKVCKARASFNNFIGVPLTLLEATPETQAVVLEVGTNHLGEIRKLGEVAHPNIAVITNVSEAHLEGLGTVEQIAREKGSLLDTLAPRGVAVLNLDNPFTAPMAQSMKGHCITFGFDQKAHIRATSLKRQNGTLLFQVNGIYTFTLHLYGWYNIYNALAAIAVARLFEMDFALCVQRLAEFSPPPMRMQKIERAGITFINDAYNANPVSSRHALEEFSGMKATGRKVAIFGDMLELGTHSEQCHRELGEAILRQKEIALVIGIGKECQALVQAVGNHKKAEHFMAIEDAIPTLKEILQPDDFVLLKGSRGMRLEKIIEEVTQR